MSFDLSRIRFDHRRDFLGVVMQQGRVQLDADWNEWVAQLARRLQCGTWDTLNGSVVPRTTPEGFLIEAVGGNLTIGPGRIYVDGLLAENHGAAPEAWDAHLAAITGTATIDYSAQPYYPDPPELPDSGTHLVYVDVWQRDVTAVEAPDLVEPAIGVDSTGRLQTVWQVKVLGDVGDINCSTADEDIPGWTAILAPSAARLTTSTGTPDFEPDPCRIPPAAGYRGLENQLYRVEVHRGGPLGTATFKWSRDNGSVASRVTHINDARDRITVERIGRDEVLRFNDGDWIEITDDYLELHNLPGQLRRIRLGGGVDETAKTLEFDDPLPPGLFPTDAQQATAEVRNTRVRRWDQVDPVRDESGAVVPQSGDGDILINAAGTRLFLEHGILVEFSLDPAGGEFRSGDHWVFAARSSTGEIELLEEAPPLGIHHHYARLAVVDFPDGETDCRTLWPPLADGQGCDCTLCVTAENHNNGTATLQQAIDQLQATGGTLCLGLGTYDISQPLRIAGARSLRIRGQGWATTLVGTVPGTLVDIESATGIAIENLSMIGSDDSSGSTAMLAARNCIDLRLSHCNLLGLAVRDGTSVGLGLSGNMLGATIEECAIVAERGIATVGTGDEEFLLSGELRVQRNLFFVSQRAISLDGISLHFGTTRIHDNLMLGADQAAVVATGATLPGSPMRITENVIYTTGSGIRTGVDGLTVEANEINGFGERSEDGIRLEEGIDPVALDHVRIQGNRLRGLGGNGIAVRHRLENAIISDNQFERLGLGVLVMSEGGAAGVLRFAGNLCDQVGTAADNQGIAYSAVQLIDVARLDVFDNSIGNVARDATSSPQINGLRVLAVGEIRISRNRLYAIGPDRGSGEVNAIQLPAPFDQAVIDDNQIERTVAAGQNAGPLTWRLIDISTAEISFPTHFANALFVSTGESAFMLSAARLAVRPAQSGHLAVRSNRLRTQETLVTPVRCSGVDDCLFSANQCEVIGQPRTEPSIGLLTARTINVSNNRMLSASDLRTLHLQSESKQAIVLGNTSSGPITLSGAPVPADIALTNIFGV